MGASGMMNRDRVHIPEVTTLTRALADRYEMLYLYGRKTPRLNPYANPLIVVPNDLPSLTERREVKHH